MGVTRADLDVAILWLENNEGDPDERTPCLKVADFLKEEARRRDVAKIAREHGISRREATDVLWRMEEP